VTIGPETSELSGEKKEQEEEGKKYQRDAVSHMQSVNNNFCKLLC